MAARWQAKYDVFDPLPRRKGRRAPESTCRTLDDALSAAAAAKPRRRPCPDTSAPRCCARSRRCWSSGARRDGGGNVAARPARRSGCEGRGDPLRRTPSCCRRRRRVRIQGEQVPLEERRWARANRISAALSRGRVAGITPFNAPFNLACHKIGPAIGRGQSIGQGAAQSPWVVSKLVELFADAGTPPGFVNLLFGNTVGPALVRIRASDSSPHRIEPGRGADQGVERAAPRRARTRRQRTTIVHSGRVGRRSRPAMRGTPMRPRRAELPFRCRTSMLHRKPLRKIRRTHGAGKLKTLRLGDPLDPATDVGTLIDEAARNASRTGSRRAIAKARAP